MPSVDRIDFEVEIQRVLLARLKSYAPLTSMVRGIWDNVPQEPNQSGRQSNDGFPYVALGDDVVGQWDTDTEIGADASATIHVWSRHRGREEVKRIQGHIYDCLHRTSFIDNGLIFVSIDQEQSQSFLDADGLTRHGIQTFRILVQSEA